MTGRFDSTRNTLGIAERRTRTRTLVTTPMYVELNHVKGGLVFNLSEDGLALTAACGLIFGMSKDGRALTAANILKGDAPLGMRIQLQDAGDWIEATGQIAWRSESGKTAGVKFIALPDSARQQIERWLAKENAQSQRQPERVAKPEQPPAKDAPAKTPEVTLQDPLNSGAVLERSTPEPALAEDSSVLIFKPAKIVAEPVPQSTKPLPDTEIGEKSSAHVLERRVHRRSRIRTDTYIDLGGDNGGMLRNIGEGGLAVTAAMPLSRTDVLTICIQFTGPQDWIKVNGQIAWIGASRREAGIRFVNVTEATRQKIASRISREELQQELPKESVKMLQGRAARPEKPEIPSVEIPIPVNWAVRPRSSRTIKGPAPLQPAAPSMRVEKSQATAVASGAWHPKSAKKSRFNPEPRPPFLPIIREGGTKRLRRFGAMFVLAAVTATAVGWVVTAPAVRNEVIAFIAKNTETTGKPTEVQESSPKSADVPAFGSEDHVTRGHGIEPLPGDRPANSSKTHPARVQRQAKTIGRPAAKPTVSGPVRRAESSASQSLPPKTLEHTVVAVLKPTVESARNQAMENSTVQTKESVVAASASASASVPHGTTVLEVKEKESPTPPPKQPAAPVGPTWSVAVSTDPYPSIRVPTSVGSQRATQGRNLQIGRAISRVEPVYPEDAKRQGIEGTVRLHVIVDRDGAVENVELTSGPALLAKAAESAVREWRYAQTLLAGQPTETEQDVVVKFKLVSLSNSKN